MIPSRRVGCCVVGVPFTEGFGSPEVVCVCRWLVLSQEVWCLLIAAKGRVCWFCLVVWRMRSLSGARLSIADFVDGLSERGVQVVVEAIGLQSF